MRAGVPGTFMALLRGLFGAIETVISLVPPLMVVVVVPAPM